MTKVSRWSGRVLAALLLAASSLAVVQVTAETQAAAYLSSSIPVSGHGFGHGYGMGQFGALGYSLAGWNWQQIVAWYYGDTSDAAPAGNPNPNISVDLTAMDGALTIVQQEKGQLAVTYGPGGSALPLIPSSGQVAVQIAQQPSGAYAVFQGPSCGGPWTPVPGASALPGPVTVSPTNVTTSASVTDHTIMLQACPPDGSHHWYRGALQATSAGGSPRTLNFLPIDAYVRGVVPRESPASWGQLAGGENALDAQAVAARTYALDHPLPICDNTWCQVYGGRAAQIGPNYSDLEGAGIYVSTSDAAVVATSGHIRVYNPGTTSPGAPAFTEYSSSTGGYTAGGSFPAVPDAGDATPSNPNHDWTTSLSPALVQAVYCGSQPLQSLAVTQRNGLGQDGGRVNQVAIQCGGTTVTDSGSGFGAKFGLLSDWFSFSTGPSGGVSGYWLVASDGGIFSFGSAMFHGSTGAMVLNKPIVGMAATPDGGGYWLVASDGGIFTFGDAPFLGSTGAIHLNQPIDGMAPTPDGRGYWLVASDGGIFAFGDARFHGSTGAMVLNKPVVGMARTASGQGYWLVASDGGIFTFGDAAFHGSTGSMILNRPIVGVAASPDGAGYRLVGADGGIFTFGSAPFYGSLPGLGVNDTVGSVAPTTDGGGYLMAGQSGAVYAFGDAPNFGGVPQVVPNYSGHVLGLAVQATAP
jgi:peptidoglycan hydrolase-like amidase